ncbi:MAG TPA: hypothetical protein VFL88_11445 [Gemmatimonadales bacterium]|nr:hypothetical protein [Gemmatimonadales bacterium]
MASPRVLVREDSEGRKRSWRPPAPDFGWKLLGWVGGVLLIVGLIDLGLAFYPPMFGNPNWEFGTISSQLNSLPVPTLGLGLLLGAAVARGWELGMRIWAIVGIVLAVFIVAAAVLWALNLPLAFRSVQEPAARLGLKKSVAKSVAQAILYPVAFLWIGWQGLRHARAKR